MASQSEKPQSVYEFTVKVCVDNFSICLYMFGIYGGVFWFHFFSVLC